MITLTEDELVALTELYRDAQNTSLMALSIADGLAGRDFSSTAWRRVKEEMDHLGKKYGFHPKNIRGINGITGEVLL